MRASTVMRLVSVVVAVLVSSAVATGSASASAGAPSAWFHLSSITRPGNIAPGDAQDEVQEVSWTKEAVTGETLFVLRMNGRPFLFAIGPYSAFFPEPTVENMQKAADSAYGAGNVEVTAGKEPDSLILKFVKADADRPMLTNRVMVGGYLSGRVNVSTVVLGRPDGYMVASVVNLGGVPADANGDPVRLTDTLPDSMQAQSYVEANTANAVASNDGPVSCSVVSARVVECVFEGKLPPYQQIEVVIPAMFDGTPAAGEENEVSVTGGGVPSVSYRHPVSVSSAATPFGVEDYRLSPEEPGGEPDVQAGSHPFQLTTTFTLKQTLAEDEVTLGESEPAGVGKDFAFHLPAGLIGNPTAYTRCTLPQFNTFIFENAGVGVKVQHNACPLSSVVGVAAIQFQQGYGVGGMQWAVLPLYNLEPGVGEPARFGFQPAGLPVILDASVRTGEDYGVTVHVDNTTQTIGFLSSTVTFWGVPGDPRHDSLRGTDCIYGTSESTAGSEPCRGLEDAHSQPFLSLPTSCTSKPLETTVLADSWAEPHDPVEGKPEPNELMPTLTGCGLLPFASEVRTAVDEPEASSPSGLKVDVHVPQEEALNQNGLAPADVKNITVSLPEGLQLNPSAADGLAACSQEEVGYEGMAELNKASEPGVMTPQFKRLVYNHATEKEEASTCPDASKIATAKITTPLLPNPLAGFVYLASPQNFAGTLENPFGSLVAMYLVAEDEKSGTIVKLPGHVTLSSSGQITASFEGNPQLPFEDAEVEFFGGERAPLATPAHCGTYTTNALFEPWSNTAQHEEKIASSSAFEITSGPNHSACPGGALPFAPSLTSGSTNVNAGNFTPLTTTISREDGQQNIQSVVLHYPSGLSGILTGIPLCPEAQANAGTCSESSLIGETIVSVGLGGDPFSVTGGKVYLTEKYAGAPFGLSIVNPAKAGPFDLQEGRPVVVRAKIQIDPVTAALTVTTDLSGPHAIPTIIEGIPLSIKHVNVTITRPGFTFNPTDCNPMQVTGAVTSDQGTTAPVGIRFQVTNCKDLSFKPSFKVSTSGKTSRRNGASLKVRLAYPKAPFGSQANIHEVKVDLPKQLPSNLKTLQHACPHQTFEANPSACQSASKVGFAKAVTPLLPVPLEGPAYFVSYGGAGFPELVIVLQGYGITLDLHGETFINEHTNITSSTFKTVPDAPVGSFELTLPQGPFSALDANANLCTHALAMPTLFVAQNGTQIKRSTAIGVTGCRPAIYVLSHSVHGNVATLTVRVPSAGTLHAGGPGLTGASKRVGKAGVATISVALSAAERRFLSQHPGRRLKAHVHLRFTHAHGGALTASANVLIG